MERKTVNWFALGPQMGLKNRIYRFESRGAWRQMAGFLSFLLRLPRCFVANVTDAAASALFNESKAFRAAGADGGIFRGPGYCLGLKPFAPGRRFKAPSFCSRT
jgi:hypothetical protein